MQNVAILAVNDGALFELGCAVELFGLERPEFHDWYRAEVICFEQPELSYTTGLKVQARRVRKLDNYTMLVVPSWQPQKDPGDSLLAREILKFHQAGKRILSFCSGSFLLGHLGILNGREATTHWRYAERFQALFPQARYLDDVLYVYDGRIGCSAGSAAGLDLGIEVIRNDFGYQKANQVARRLVLSAHRKGGQSQFVEAPVLRAPGKFAEALDWCVENLSSVRNVAVLAERARMSRRTFDRKFRAAFGISANDWLIEQRLEFSRALLEETGDSVERIAATAGFGSAITMRYHFREKFGISPTRYRDQFMGA